MHGAGDVGGDFWEAEAAFLTNLHVFTEFNLRIDEIQRHVRFRVHFLAVDPQPGGFGVLFRLLAALRLDALSGFLPGVDRPLAQLSILVSDSGELVAELEEALLTPSGQLELRFDAPRPSTGLPSALRIALSFSSRAVTFSTAGSARISSTTSATPGTVSPSTSVTSTTSPKATTGSRRTIRRRTRSTCGGRSRPRRSARISNEVRE